MVMRIHISMKLCEIPTIHFDMKDYVCRKCPQKTNFRYKKVRIMESNENSCTQIRLQWPLIGLVKLGISLIHWKKLRQSNMRKEDFLRIALLYKFWGIRGIPRTWRGTKFMSSEGDSLFHFANKCCNGIWIKLQVEVVEADDRNCFLCRIRVGSRPQ